MFTNAQLVKLATILKLDTSPDYHRTEGKMTINEQPVPSWQQIHGAE